MSRDLGAPPTDAADYHPRRFAHALSDSSCPRWPSRCSARSPSTAVAIGRLLVARERRLAERRRHRHLYWILFALAVVVFIGVEGALIYSLFKFRARKGAVPAQIRGNTRLEIGWTVGAAVILVVIAVVTFIQLDDIRNAPDSDRERACS